MGLLRRILGKLFDPPTASLEEIVFERLDDAPTRAEGRSGISVSLEEFIPCVPYLWLRSGDWSVHQIIEIPSEAFLESSPERPAVVSLRYLAGAYPLIFRDPGANQPDPGADLPMSTIRDPFGLPETIPTEVVAETSEQRLTFSELEGEERPPEERSVEARETAVALRGIRLPPTSPAERGVPFEATLAAQPVISSPQTTAPSVATPASVPAQPPQPAQPSRIRKILAAYAEGLTQPPKEAVPVAEPLTASPVSSLAQSPLLQSVLERRRVPLPEIPDDLLLESAPLVTGKAGGGLSGASFAPLGNSGIGVAMDLEPYKMRFEELGLSLSRFPEVKGFALWQGGRSSHTGDLGFDLELSALRIRLERLLDGAVQVQGAQDGFSSVTLNHARGGMSVFGSGSALVAVAHQHDGLPSNLRAWMCGWVSQPLRG